MGEVRDIKGRFAPGHCGGPGRRRGQTLADKLRRSIDEDEAIALLQLVMKQAMGGCLTSQREILARAWPIRDASAAELMDRLEELREQVQEVEQCKTA